MTKITGYLRFTLKTRIARAKATIAKKQKQIVAMEKELAKINKAAKTSKAGKRK